MSDNGGLRVSKPISIWNRPLKTDFKALFKSLSKAVVHGLTLNWVETTKNIADAVSAIGLEKDAGQIAWLLIYRSIVEAMYGLVKDNIDLVRSSPGGYWNLREQTDLSKDELEMICQRIDFSLENNQLVIEENFFKRPAELSVIQDLKTPFSEWLSGAGLSEAQAKAISDRLPTYFVYALNDQWRTRREDYVYLTEILDTPFIKATEREQAWSRYAAWLQKQVEEPMFYEAFSLKQLYISPRAYYERKATGERGKEIERSIGEEQKRERIVVSLEKILEEWLNNTDPQDSTRVISGGPGFGKSSFAKMFAAQQCNKTDRRILFIPLHRFELADDLIDAVKDFVEIEGFLPHNPLDPKDGESRLLIIFDGLDELSMQGKLAAEVAQKFAQEVQRKADSFNSREPRLKVLISGRELVVQANASEFRKPRQVLYILPYYLDDQSKSNYVDTEKILEQDQRQLWWTAYGKVSGRAYDGMPGELTREQLVEITSQPLLNYLVALSYVRGELDFANEGNLNAIYKDLLQAVYERVWGEGRSHPSTEEVSEIEFFRILEEIAVASWHGDGRTSTIREVEAHCEMSGLKPLLDKFKGGAKEGIARLLLAFYFRKSGNRLTGDETFEFTHKSFGEYLTARRIVRSIQRIHEELKRRKESYERGWDEREALRYWIMLCGPSAMTDYLFGFIRSEVSLQPKPTVEEWQETISRLIGFMLRYGTPMELLNPRPSFNEEFRQARNVEEALLAALNACARFTEKLSVIDWPSPDAFGDWITRFQGQRKGNQHSLFLRCASFIDLRGCVLAFKDLQRVSIEYGNLEGVDLRRANLQDASLDHANLSEANLFMANLQNASLTDAILQRANLTAANLQFAYSIEADLQGAILVSAHLLGTAFMGANLQGAILKYTNLKSVMLNSANLAGANLEEASLDTLKLEQVNLEGATWTDGRKIKGTSEGKLLFEDGSEIEIVLPESEST